MSTTIRPATPDDSPAIAAIWNRKSGQSTSCFYGAIPMGAGYVEKLIGSFEFYVAEVDDEVAAFGFWSRNERDPLFVATTADTAEVYYRLFRQCARRGLERGCTAGYTSIGQRDTEEFAWVKALEVATFSIDPRDSHKYRVEADYLAVVNKINQLIGE